MFRLIVHNCLPNIVHFSILRRQKEKGQIWLGLAKESPQLLNSNAPKGNMDGVFHWIGSYRKDADVHWPYGHVVRLRTPKEAVNQTIPL